MRQQERELGIFFDTTLEGRGDSIWSLVAAIIWVFVYVTATTAIVGRTPGKGIIGLRVVTKLGSAVTPGRVVVRTAVLPIAVATGFYTVDALREHQPAAVFEDLSDTAAVIDAIMA